MLQARDLKTSTSTSAETDHVPAPWTSPGNWSWPENSTSDADTSVVCAKAIASPATARPAAGRGWEMCATSDGWVARAIRKTTKHETGMATAMGIVQAKSATSGRAK